MKAIISTNSRIRHPEHFVIGEDSIVDDYCYFSTSVRIGRCTHIASGCSIAGGADMHFQIGQFCSLSSGVKIWCTSDDFVNDIITIIPSGIEPVKKHLIRGDVVLDDYTAIGSNSVVMPNNHVPEGTVHSALYPWLLNFAPGASTPASLFVSCGKEIERALWNKSAGSINRSKHVGKVRKVEQEKSAALPGSWSALRSSFIPEDISGIRS
jgi:carbonic anhydrase/acetyltransferase-like protein (isoleucine patch superfamily)